MPICLPELELRFLHFLGQVTLPLCASFPHSVKLHNNNTTHRVVMLSIEYVDISKVLRKVIGV